MDSNESRQPLLPDGHHLGHIADVLHELNGVALTTGAGDPMLVLVLEAPGGRVSRYLPLSSAAERLVWDTLVAVGHSKTELKASGFRVQDLSGPDISGKMLKGKDVAFAVEHRCANSYPTVTIYPHEMIAVLRADAEDKEDPDPFEV